MIALPTLVNDVTLRKSCLPIEKPKGILLSSISHFCLLEDVLNHHSFQNLTQLLIVEVMKNTLSFFY